VDEVLVGVAGVVVSGFEESVVVSLLAASVVLLVAEVPLGSSVDPFGVVAASVVGRSVVVVDFSVAVLSVVPSNGAGKVAFVDDTDASVVEATVVLASLGASVVPFPAFEVDSVVAFSPSVAPDVFGSVEVAFSAAARVVALKGPSVVVVTVVAFLGS